MRILLDTHIVLWVLAGSNRIEPIRDVILSCDSEVYISAASWWELAIKIGLKKFEGNLPEIRAAAAESGFIELPVKGEHTEALIALPPYHKDPFDRILLAQATTEPLRLITADKNWSSTVNSFGKYPEIEGSVAAISYWDSRNSWNNCRLSYHRR